MELIGDALDAIEIQAVVVGGQDIGTDFDDNRPA
jgi:hypothetical protein